MTRQWLSTLEGDGAGLAAGATRRGGRWWQACVRMGLGLGLFGSIWLPGPGAQASSLPAANGIPAGRTGSLAAPRLLADFSAATWSGWENMTYLPWDPKNVYSRLDTPDGPVVRVDSHGAASMLLRRVTLDPAREPLVRWRWRITAPVAEADETDATRDDCAARVYFLWGLRSRADLLATTGLAYVWGRVRPVGAVAASPLLSQVGVFTLRSGERGAGRWQTEQRDLDADYRAFFKRPPPGPVTVVLLLTDTDQTKGKATAWYGPVEASARR